MIGLVLMFALIFAVQYINRPTEEELAAIKAEEAQLDSLNRAQVAQQQAETIAPEIISTTPATPDSAQLARMEAERNSTFGVFAAATTGEEGTVSIANEVLRVDLNRKGGSFEQATLISEYRTYWDSTDIRLWDAAHSSHSFVFDYPGKGQMSTGTFYFTPQDLRETAS